MKLVLLTNNSCRHRCLLSPFLERSRYHSHFPCRCAYTALYFLETAFSSLVLLVVAEGFSLGPPRFSSYDEGNQLRHGKSKPFGPCNAGKSLDVVVYVHPLNMQPNFS